MPVLQQRRLVAQLASDLEMLGGRIEIGLLTQDVRQGDVQLARGREHGPGWPSAAASARSQSRRASRGRPRASHIFASTTVAPSSSATIPAACRLATDSLNVSTAVPRSPAAHAARPTKPAAAPRGAPASSLAERRSIARASGRIAGARRVWEILLGAAPAPSAPVAARRERLAGSLGSRFKAFL